MAKAVTAVSFRMPRRFLRGSAGRLALTVLALASGVALVCAIDLVNRAVFLAFVETIDTMAGRAALHVSAGEGGLLPEAVASTVESVPGVELAVPVVSASAFMTDGSGEQLSVHGIDITDDAAVRVHEPAETEGLEIEDPLVFLNQADSVILTREFAARHGLEVDDRIDLDTATGRRRFVVRGLLAPRGIARAQKGNLVIMDIAAAEAVFTRAGLVHRVDVVVGHGADVARVRDAIAAVLPPGLRVDAPVQRKADLQKVMRSIQTFLHAVGMLGLVAAFLIGYSRLTTAFESRAWQLAILRAVGLRTRRVWWELAKESLLVGAVGVMIGIPLGIGLAHVLLPAIATTTAISSKLTAAAPTLSVRPWSVGVAAALGLAAVVLAAALPALRAARVAVAETLRHRGVEQEEMEGAAFAMPRGVLLLALALSVAVHLATGSTPWGLAASALVVVAAAASVRPVLVRLAAPLERAAPLLAGPIGRFAVAIVVRNPRRTALAVSTLGVGFGGVLWLWTAALSFESSLNVVMPGVLRGDLAVSSANIGAGYVEAPVHESLVSQLVGLPGVAAAVGEQTKD